LLYDYFFYKLTYSRVYLVVLCCLSYFFCNDHLIECKKMVQV